MWLGAMKSVTFPTGGQKLAGKWYRHYGRGVVTSAALFGDVAPDVTCRMYDYTTACRGVNFSCPGGGRWHRHHVTVFVLIIKSKRNTYNVWASRGVHMESTVCSVRLRCVPPASAQWLLLLTFRNSCGVFVCSVRISEQTTVIAVRCTALIDWF